ncbi:MAG: hypothetical protein ACYS26_09320 [Planctomycetota bacterium]|jgi:hypothetical protein
MRTLIALSLLSAPALAQGDFTVLGPGLFANSVSADGSTITGDNSFEYFLWTDSGGLQLIGGAPPQGNGGQATIDWDATTVSGTYIDPGTGLGQSGRYDIATGQWTALGGIGGQSGSSIGSGWGISGDGSTSVGLGWISAGGAHATSWTAATGMIDLGSTVPDRSSRANACDFDGNVVGGWQDATTGFRQGAIWVDGVQQIVMDGAASMGEVSCVSGDGRWAGGLGVSANNREAYIYSDATGVISLGHLAPTNSGGTSGVSADGKTAVGFDRPFGPALFGQGFVWRPDTGMSDLNDVATFLGIDTQGVTMSLPLGVSPDGRTIVGAGRQGITTVGWRLRLPEADCGVVLFGFGGSSANELVLVGDGSGSIGTNVDLTVTNAFGDVALLAVSGGAADAPLGDVLLRIDANLFSGLFTMTPGTGGAVFSTPLPNDAGLVGGEVFAQAFAFEPGQVGQLAGSNGLKLKICN